MQEHYAHLQELNCEVYSVSEDSHYVHKAWADATETIGKIKYPMLADPNGQLARFFGVLDEASGMAYRASFIVSPEGTSNLMKSTTWVLVVMLKNLFVN